MLNPFTQCNRLTLLLLGLLEDLLDDLLLLNEESTDNAVFLGRETWAYSRGRRAGTPWSLEPQSYELSTAGLYMRPGLTYTALGGSALLLDVQVTELTTGRLDDADLLALGVVGGATPLPFVSLQS